MTISITDTVIFSRLIEWYLLIIAIPITSLVKPYCNTLLNYWTMTELCLTSQAHSIAFSGKPFLSLEKCFINQIILTLKIIIWLIMWPGMSCPPRVLKILKWVCYSPFPAYYLGSFYHLGWKEKFQHQGLFYPKAYPNLWIFWIQQGPLNSNYKCIH